MFLKKKNRKLTCYDILYMFSNYTKFYAIVHCFFPYHIQDSTLYLIALSSFSCREQNSGKFSSFLFYDQYFLIFLVWHLRYIHHLKVDI